MKVKLILFLGMLSFLTLTYATPPYMDIGTYALSDGPNVPDGCTGSLLSGLDFVAIKFYEKAVEYRPSGGPTPDHKFGKVNKQVTVASCNNTNSPGRYCDFIWIGTHGDPRELSVWNAAGNDCDYSYTPQMAFGGSGSYTRWVYLGGCHALKYNRDNPNEFDDFFRNSGSWADAFKGVQCIIGFSSVGLPKISGVWDVFWKRWTGSGSEPACRAEKARLGARPVRRRARSRERRHLQCQYPPDPRRRDSH